MRSEAPILLRSTFVGLDDVGAPDYSIALAVCANGEHWPWLVGPDADADATVCVPSHEEVGELPANYQRLVREIAYRCCRRTQSGGRCMNKVMCAGSACHRHRATSKEVDQ
ncbi:hypothetical protein [Mycolicibacterium sp. HS_4_1]